jgi:hypothetical protein
LATALPRCVEQGAQSFQLATPSYQAPLAATAAAALELPTPIGAQYQMGSDLMANALHRTVFYFSEFKIFFSHPARRGADKNAAGLSGFLEPGCNTRGMPNCNKLFLVFSIRDRTKNGFATIDANPYLNGAYPVLSYEGLTIDSD